MSNKHTPGPWFVYPQHADRFIVGNRARSGAGVCRVTADCSPRQVITGAGDDTMTEDECIANARIIAASPELLEALRYIERACIPAGIDQSDDELELFIARVRKIARDAISKATEAQP